MTPDHLLQVSALRTGYGRIQVVHGVDLAAPRGSVVGLLGPSGAGKSTTLHAIAGLRPVTSGQVRVDGERVDGLAPHQIARRGVGLLPEAPAVFASLTVAENLRLGHQAAGSAAGPGPDAPDDDPIDRAVGVFPQLAGLLQRTAGSLSGGEQQMVALARVFLARPRLLLLDEISMGLAPKLVHRLYEPVARLRDEGVTIVLVEQQLTHALRLADLCYVMVNGRIRLVAEPGELRRGTAAVAGYLGT